MKFQLYCILCFILLAVSVVCVVPVEKLDLSKGKLKRSFRFDCDDGTVVKATSATKEFPISAVVGASKHPIWMSTLHGIQHISFTFPYARQISLLIISIPKIDRVTEMHYQVRYSSLEKGKFKFASEKIKAEPGAKDIKINDVVKRLYIDLYPKKGSYFGKVDIYVPAKIPPFGIKTLSGEDAIDMLDLAEVIEDVDEGEIVVLGKDVDNFNVDKAFKEVKKEDKVIKKKAPETKDVKKTEKSEKKDAKVLKGITPKVSKQKAEEKKEPTEPKETNWTLVGIISASLGTFIGISFFVVLIVVVGIAYYRRCQFRDAQFRQRLLDPDI